MSKKSTKTQKLESLSVFFPCYNEEKNLPVLLEQALDLIPKYAHKYEIIVVNDGSKDSTLKIARAYEKKYSSIKVVSQRNRGYGGAVRTGLKVAKYKWIFFTDSDLQFNLKELSKFVKHALNTNDDLIIGYRIKRAEGIRRSVMASGMKLWNRVWFGFPSFIKDIDCAFKLIKRDVVSNILPLKSTGNLVSTEFLLKAYKKGYSFHQIGVRHYNRKCGKSTCGSIESIWLVIIETFKLIPLFKIIKPSIQRNVKNITYKLS